MEANKIKMNMNGTFRAKVLQYKSDGNTLAKKWQNLTKYSDGVYYFNEYEGCANICFKKNAIIWAAFAIEEWKLSDEQIKANILRYHSTFETVMFEAAKNNKYVRLLDIEVMKQLGYDVAPLYASRNTYLKTKEEEEEKTRLQRIESEKRRREEYKAKAIADGKEKLLNHEKITVEQIELLAAAVGCTIHARTLGTMRGKLLSMSYNADGSWDYSFNSYQKISSRSFYGVADVVEKIYNLLKLQTEKESKQAA